MNTKIIEQYLDNQKIKAVEVFDFEKKKVKYSEKIKGWKIDKFRGDEEIVRAYLLAKLVNELGYKLENIELEKFYPSGRPKTTNPRIDILVKDEQGNPYLFMELKSPQDYEKNKDKNIDDQLFSLAGIEQSKYGTKIKYLAYYTIDVLENSIKDKALIIDYEKYSSFSDWEKERNFTDELPARYGKAQKEPYVKGKKDLITDFERSRLDSLRNNLHNVLWGGGGTDDNEVFASLTRLILAKIQDEYEKNNGEKYDFQIFSAQDGEAFESQEEIYKRINELYRRALRNILSITDENEVAESFVINRSKFSLSKLKYTVAELESYSFVGGKNSFDGKDILGDFFEGIIKEGFKQNKGQFFTHINVVKFLLWGLQIDKLTIDCINKKQRLPFVIDPSAGSGTFLIEYMKFVTNAVKRIYTDKLDSARNVQTFVQKSFYPNDSENQWANEYIYGTEINPDLGTSVKVNMVLHGDGSANIFVGSDKGDGLSKFSKYIKLSGENTLTKTAEDKTYPKLINGSFDVIITNPPFSVTLDKDTAENLKNIFMFGEKKNSENLFVERWYQLLQPGGRLGAVLPESVFDTTENKYIRLFIYKYFKVKAVVSLPQVTFEPFTSTKTSLLFAQKKTKAEIEKWDELWRKYSSEWGNLQTRCDNLLEIYLNGKDRQKLPSIKNLKEKEEKELLMRMLKNYIEKDDQKLSTKALVEKYASELKYLCKYDNDTTDAFGFVNTWWVFGEVAKELNYKIFMAEVGNVGYKRTKRGEKPMPNELFKTSEKGEISVDSGKLETVLDYMRKIEWD